MGAVAAALVVVAAAALRGPLEVSVTLVVVHPLYCSILHLGTVTKGSMQGSVAT